MIGFNGFVLLYFLGHYCAYSDQPINDYTLYPCPAGHYCTNATAWSTQHPCLAGSYSTSTHLEAADECTPCDPGKYCDDTTKTAVTGKTM